MTGYRRTRSALLRGLGVAYLAAFGSLAVQLDGLIGSRGILPAAEYLDRAGQFLGRGPATYWRLPTVFWLGASDRALHAACWGGVVLAAALAAGFLPGPCAALLWGLYLSLTTVGQVFLGYQWDSLLLEAGLLGVLLAPWGLRLSRAADQPWGFSVWLVRWLVFRLMFLSGVVKLASGDPAWWDWKALDYHYQTQPLPTWTSWYVHQLPPSFQRMSVGFMFYAELVAPSLIFGPRPTRLVAFVSLVILQLLIAATGNYGFFNLLSVVLCLALLDDRDWRWLGRRGPDRAVSPVLDSELRTNLDEAAPARPWSWPRKLAVGLIGAGIVAVTAADTLETVSPAIEAVANVPVIIPAPIEILGQWVAPLRSTNRYGLFAVMTTSRPEIIVEGSEDGTIWRPYRFRWKPCEPDRKPRFSTPHLPRLDWQMWFAALAGDCRSQPWFLRFERKLLDGSPEVLGLLRHNPFPDRPPRYIRARLFLYSFTRRGSKDWWDRQVIGEFCPPVD